MRRTSVLIRSMLSASLAAIVAVTPSGAQGKGKGGGGEERGNPAHGGGRPADVRGAAQGKGRQEARVEHRAPQRDQRGNQSERASARGQERRDATPLGEQRRNERANVRTERNEARRDERAETRSDTRIERQLERSLGGDVELRGAKGRASPFMRHVTLVDLRPSLRRHFVADRIPARIAVGALARAQLRGVDDDEFIIMPVTDHVSIRNRRGDVLVDLDDARARDLGRWDVIPLDDHVREGAPAFCRSGAGHPVWGRQWCIDKGFGLGVDNDIRWGRTTRVEDIVLGRRTLTGSLVGDALLTLLGPTAYDRLALHAITLGLADPLVGRWMGEPAGPRVLLVSSGPQPVAELVDLNNDDRADLMLVALRDY